jgi:hypothetical protein
VIFLIGLRVNKPLLIHKWLPPTMAMPRMLAELTRQPELGLLHSEMYRSGLTVQNVQYWRSFDHLHAYAHAKDMEHLPAWAEFNRQSRGNDAVGIFHETYLIAANQYECIHVNMPRQGLLHAGIPVPVTDRNDNARQRLAQVQNLL